ncbi:MAG: T9SS type A sorting domain-containing protein [Crocinitomix sp.]|nr:T9SS type A sorting domain-containing protein [Crocinitomix sp.]
MKNLILFVLLAISAGSFEQEWNENDQFDGGSGRFGMSYFTLEGEAFLMGGLMQSGVSYIAYDDLQKYDESTDTWELLADYPGGNLYGGFTFVIGNTAYIGLGANQDGTFNNEVWSFSTIDGWNSVSDFPGTLRVFPFSFSTLGNGYIGGGSSPELLTDLWGYDPITDVWTAKEDYPGGGKVGQVSFSIADKGYVGLGDDGSFYYNDFYEYDPLINAWFAKASFSGVNRSFAARTIADNNGYILGGEDVGGGFTGDMWKYAPVSNVWSPYFNFTGTPRRNGVLFFLGNTFYYGMGQFGFSDTQVLGDFWEYQSDIAANLDEDHHATEVPVYPNPFENYFEVITNTSSKFNIRVYNTLMQEVYIGNELIINTADWKPSVYYLQIETDEGIISKMIVKE